MRLKAEKFQDTRVMTKQRKQIQELEVQLKNESEKSAELQGTLRDHQSMSADNHGLIDELQAKISHLETVSFVMGERAKQFAEEVHPRRREVIELAEQRSHQDKELARTLRMVASLKQAVSHKQEQLRYSACSETCTGQVHADRCSLNCAVIPLQNIALALCLQTHQS